MIESHVLYNILGKNFNIILSISFDHFPTTVMYNLLIVIFSFIFIKNKL